MTRPLRLTQEQVNRFASASGDSNPVHVDESFARETPYGRCISHGALLAVAALGIADADRLGSAEAIEVRFGQPAFPGEEHVISLADSNPERIRIEVTRGGRVTAVVAVTTNGDHIPLPAVLQLGPSHFSSSPREYSFADLAEADLSVREQYTCRMDLLTALATDLGAGHVPQALLAWLAAASYTVGMLIPGRDAVFIGARIVRSFTPTSGRLTVSVLAADDRTALIGVDAELDQTDASARMSLQAFLRPPVPAPERSSIGRYLPPSKELSERNVLVVGASRGLGAALSGTLATQGATVWAGFARSSRHVDRLRQEFNRDRIRPLRFDAEDREQTHRAFEVIRDHGRGLDGVVLCAAPPPYESALHPETSGEALQFLQSSLATVLNPLAEALQLLSQDGWLVVMSSSVVEDPPQAWPHYVIAKAAVEGAATYCARHAAARVLIVRAPQMWTDSTNTPLGRIGAVPTEQVAAAITRWATSNKGSGCPSVLAADTLTKFAG